MSNNLAFHGLRSNAASGWRQSLTHVVTGNWAAVPRAPATSDTELGLGIEDRPCYFYLMRSERAFGFVVFAFRRKRNHSDTDTRGATPFDSGGLWHGHIRANTPLDGHARRQLFEVNDTPLSDATAVFDDYIGSNYIETSEYVLGRPPRDGTTPIIAGPPNTSRAWTWELRVPVDRVSDYADLVCCFITEAAIADYRNWLWYESDIEDGVAGYVETWATDHVRLAPEGTSAALAAQHALLAGEIE